MKRMLTLTLFGLLAISCISRNSAYSNSSKDSSMTYTAGTQADLDAGNKRIHDYRQELLRQGFHEISTSLTTQTGDSSDVNAKEKFILEGPYRNLKDLRVTLWTTKRLEKENAELGGGIYASIKNEQDDRDFEELYKKVSFVVTGFAQ